MNPEEKALLMFLVVVAIPSAGIVGALIMQWWMLSTPYEPEEE